MRLLEAARALPWGSGTKPTGGLGSEKGLQVELHGGREGKREGTKKGAQDLGSRHRRGNERGQNLGSHRRGNEGGEGGEHRLNEGRRRVGKIWAAVTGEGMKEAKIWAAVTGEGMKEAKIWSVTGEGMKEERGKHRLNEGRRREAKIWAVVMGEGMKEAKIWSVTGEGMKEERGESTG
ncbi:octapeptide-repeat protein T2-like [Dioscorea cayenensis subsp. rotundata]|uniref:Octapeptide-repeat protein T2-like n=1 Tax=Dioscorea cayennensis subsp. rotundata TaxID=55577 RepID=A0AB40C752_DIOCR|nr:octapeptide-repeat protein T2-like [Dioscorea cayenensis subsp. rotundata]